MPRSGTGRIYRRGETWWIDYSFRGERYRESSGSTKNKDAVELLRKRMAEMRAGAVVGPTEEQVTFEDLRAMHMDNLKANGKRTTWARCAWSNLEESFAGMRAVDLTTDRIERHVARRQEDEAANSTIQKELSALKRAFNLAHRAKRLTTRPYVPSVKVNNAREGFIEGKALDALLEALDDDVRPVVEFASLTGWRKGEIIGMKWSQVDFDAGVVRLAPGTTKNDEGREFPFRALPPLAALLERQRKRTRTLEKKRREIIPHVWHRDGTPIRTIRRAWKRATKAAGLPDALFHDLRRSAVRALERAGVSRSVAMKLTGHKTEAVYRRYAIADRSALEEGLGKLAELHAGTKEPRKVVSIMEAAP